MIRLPELAALVMDLSPDLAMDAHAGASADADGVMHGNGMAHASQRQ